MVRRTSRLQRAVDLPRGAVLSVNVGRARAVERDGKPASTAIWKSPVPGRVRARGVNLDGDEQADRSVHGGYDKAVYAYAVEDTRWWETELGRTIGPGGFGENLTVEGLDLVDSVVAERIVSRPDHGFTVGDIWRVYHQDRHDAGVLLDVPQLGTSWREWAEGRVQRMAES